MYMNQLCGTTTTIPAVIKRVGKSLGFAFNITSRYSSINKYRNIGGLSISIIFTIVVFMLVKSEETLGIRVSHCGHANVSQPVLICSKDKK